MPSLLCLFLSMVQFHSPEHSTMYSFINVVGGVCVVEWTSAVASYP
jgi:hypothetical protein